MPKEKDIWKTQQQYGFFSPINHNLVALETNNP